MKGSGATLLKEQKSMCYTPKNMFLKFGQTSENKIMDFIDRSYRGIWDLENILVNPFII